MPKAVFLVAFRPCAILDDGISKTHALTIYGGWMRCGDGMRQYVTEKIQGSEIGGLYVRFALLRAGPAGSKEGAFFCGFAARLKPCPDTCMVDGCDMVEHAEWRTSFRERLSVLAERMRGLQKSRQKGMRKN
ncbi:MAG TPA: hypothetical protein VGK21_10130 [Candidatus Angelobacter sp.]|jgi:hypothetical protein